MKTAKNILPNIPEYTFICFGILLALSPHSRENSLYFPVLILTALFIIQLIGRNDLMGFSLGILETLITVTLILGRFPVLWKLTHYTSRTTWIFIGHGLILLTCLVMGIALIRKYFLLFRHKIALQENPPVAK